MCCPGSAARSTSQHAVALQSARRTPAHAGIAGRCASNLDFCGPRRRALGPAEADAGTELDVWQHFACSSRSSVAASLHPDAANRLRMAFANFAKEEQPIRQKVLDLLRSWRHGLPDEIWFEELDQPRAHIAGFVP